MKENAKDRSVTIRIPVKLFDELTQEAIRRSVEENRLVKLSEVIREKMIK
jgi:transcriptional regulator of met regulon